MPEHQPSTQRRTKGASDKPFSTRTIKKMKFTPMKKKAKPASSDKTK